MSRKAKIINALTVGQLRAIASTLPITADGVIATPGMKLYPKEPIDFDHDPEGDEPPDFSEDYAVVRICAEDENGDDIEADDFRHNYSTFEAAAAARAKPSAR